MLMTVSSAAFAQTNSTPAPMATTPMKTAATPPMKTTANGTNIQAQLTTDLQRAGFTDVKIMPDSFLVQAKDKTGDPVTLFLSPGSIAEVTVDSSGQVSKAGSVFAKIPVTDDLSSKLVGLDVYNDANQNIGTIKDIAFNAAGVKAYIISVGGFLGMGEHYVAMQPSAISLSYSAKNKTWRATTNTNAAELKAAPEYKYSS
jgi:hypothetical protein